MKLEAFTIALDAMPWLPYTFVELNRLDIDWHWTIVVGVANNVKCSSHCKEIEPRLPRDGTMKFLNSIRNHPKISIVQKTIWQGKIEMVNFALKHIKEPCVLMQIDSDELWNSHVLKEIFLGLSTRPSIGYAFRCRYFVGPNLYCKDQDTYGNYDYEWVRAWHRQPNQMFNSHCPPVLDGQDLGRVGWTFDHMAWVYPEQVKFKEKYYGYRGAYAGWKRLQEHKEFPSPLKPFFSWADEKSMVYQLYDNR